MIPKKWDVSLHGSEAQKNQTKSWWPLASMFLLMLAGALLPLVDRFPLPYSLILSLVFVGALLVGAGLQGRIGGALRFFQEHYLNQRTIISELVGADEIQARLSELAHAMHEIHERQTENQRSMKRASKLEVREHHRQVDAELSKEFKGLQERFYSLLRALAAEDGGVNPEATFTDYLFPFPKEENSGVTAHSEPGVDSLTVDDHTRIFGPAVG
jgi:hypothetical protein